MTPSPRVSVAMATYNGERHLAQQLESLATQTRVPDELVISDDSSNDRTVDLVRHFSERSPFAVHLLANDHNLGFNSNFDRAVAGCAGDVIFLCDQDDVWLPRKIEDMLAALVRHPSAGLAVSNSEYTDQYLRPLGYTRYATGSGHFPDHERLYAAGVSAARFLININGPAGHTMAFRRAPPLMSPTGDIALGCAHDAVRGILAASLYGVVALPTRLTLYRRHPGQVTHFSETPLPSFKRLRRRLRNIFVAYERTAVHQRTFGQDMLKIARGVRVSNGDQSVVRFLEGKAHLAEFAANLPSARLARVTPVLANLSTGRYSAYGNGLATALRDLLIPSGPHS